jgi:uncharacterized protein
LKSDIPGLALAAFAILVARYVFPGYLTYAIICLIVMGAAPIGYIILRGRKPKDYLLQKGDLWGGLKISAALILLAMPIMYYGSTLKEFQDYYPTWPPARKSLWNLVLYESYMLALMISTEVFYRGFLMNLLLQKTRYGNILHSIIYMIVHLGKPPLEVIYSLPVGYVFGQIDGKHKSIIPSLIMHFTSSLIFDLLVLHQAGIRLI